MISNVTAAALERIAERADDLRGAFVPGFEPRESSGATRALQLTRDLNPLSVVAPADTFFVSAGPNGARFSRDGGFAVADGQLRTRDGAAVLGFVDGANAPAPLRLDPIDVALGRVSGARIEPDGTFAYQRAGVDPRSGARRSERVVAGRLALARFPAGTAPVRGDATHVEAPSGVPPAFGRPGEGGFGLLQPFARDLGRVDPIGNAQRLGEAYLSFEALRAAGSARNDFAHVALDLVK